MLAVQADGADITTIEGLADGGELHPMQEAFRENHGLQCGFCTPGMVMAAVGLLEGEPQPDRGRGAARPRGQPVPLHRLPQHREGGAGRRGAAGGRAHDQRSRRRPTAASSARRMLRKEDPALLTGEAQLHRRPRRSPARCTSPSSAARTPTPASAASTCRRALGDARRRRRATRGADLHDAWAPRCRARGRSPPT